MPRWILLFGLLAACEDESKAPAKPVAHDAAVVAAVPAIDAAPAPAAPDAEPKVALMSEENRKKLDVIMDAKLSDELSKFTGLPDPGAKVKLEGATGDFGGLTRQEVDRVVKSRKGMFQACFQRALKDDPKLAGKLVLAFTIDADGKVTKASIETSRSTLQSSSVEDCVKRQVMGLKFPAKGGASVVYPFVFASA